MKRFTLLLVALMVACGVFAKSGFLCGTNWIELSPANEIYYVESNSQTDSNKNNEFLSKNIKNDNVQYKANVCVTQYGDSLIVLPRIIIKLKNGCEIGGIQNDFAKKLVMDKHSNHGIYKFDCLAKNDNEVLEIVKMLSNRKEVEWCEPNMLVQIHYYNTLYNQQYYLKNTGQNGGTPGLDINAESAWQIVTGSSNIKVAVIDTGVESGHEDLTGSVLSGYTIGDENGLGAPYGNDAIKAHGTACAGIIGARNNNIGIRGVASGVKILPINNEPGFYIYNDMDSIAESIRWAYQRADIISCSWGTSTSNSIREAIIEATTLGRKGKGCLVVFAAGNDGSNVSFPAYLNQVLAVGAINPSGQLCSYSNRGDSLNLVAFGNNIVTTDRVGATGFDAGNYTSTFTGTSAACPQVAGVAALMLSINSYLPEFRIREILQNTAQDLGATGFDPYYGYGLVDAGAAVLQAKNEKPDFSITKTYVSANELICSVASLPSYFTTEWSILNGNMTTAINNSPHPNQCTFTKSTSGLPTGMIMLKVKYGDSVVYTTVTSISVSSVGHYNQTACTYYNVGHPAIPSTTITSGGQAKFVHQGCRVYLYSDVLSLYNVSHTGIVPEEWYNAGDHVEFALPYGSGGAPFVVNVKDNLGNLLYFYTFMTVSNNGNVLNANPISSNIYEISLEDNDQVNDNWQLEILDSMSSSLKYSQLIATKSAVVDMTEWPYGIYIIRASKGNQIYTKKIIVK